MSSNPPSRRARALAALPAAAVAALALAAVPAQVRTAWQWLQESPRGIARDAGAARRDAFGDAYVDLVESLRGRVPADGSYAIADDSKGRPERNWLRCDLAPRTPVLLLPQACGGFVLDRTFARLPEMAVVVGPDGAARIAEARTILSGLWSGLAGPEAEVPGWMDAPAEGARATGRVTVEGWCQERGGPPCVAIRVWVDGRELDSARVETFPRPDVCASVAGMRDCTRAGWRLSLAPGEAGPGSHCVAAALIAGGGRFRRVGPWAFTVSP